MSEKERRYYFQEGVVCWPDLATYVVQDQRQNCYAVRRNMIRAYALLGHGAIQKNSKKQ